MNVIFMGTPDFAVPCLEKLIKLEERGIEDGDTVSLDGYEFEYQY